MSEGGFRFSHSAHSAAHSAHRITAHSTTHNSTRTGVADVEEAARLAALAVHGQRVPDRRLHDKAVERGAKDAVIVVAVDELGVRDRLVGAHAIHDALLRVLCLVVCVVVCCFGVWVVVVGFLGVGWRARGWLACCVRL